MTLPRSAYALITLGTAALVLSALVFAKTLLIPLVIAIFIWYLLNALALAYGRIVHLPGWASMTASVLTVSAILAGLVEMISN
ncbi:MAG: hypothetical protein OQJ99_07320, partial [Rhodospirillales bacterium]|nr:hypothetical protein [Rhodospirillales bacterium]